VGKPADKLYGEGKSAEGARYRPFLAALRAGFEERSRSSGRSPVHAPVKNEATGGTVANECVRHRAAPLIQPNNVIDRPLRMGGQYRRYTDGQKGSHTAVI
jgi:hypothetical protein